MSEILRIPDLLGRSEHVPGRKDGVDRYVTPSVRFRRIFVEEERRSGAPRPATDGEADATRLRDSGRETSISTGPSGRDLPIRKQRFKGSRESGESSASAIR
jgi:hypothetical protein